MPVESHRFTAEEAAPLIGFAEERHAVYLRKSILERARPPEWADPSQWYAAAELYDFAPARLPERLTPDPILAQYRFCNAFRELDRVTVWVRENIREPYAQHEHLWWMLAAARFVNWPPTLQMLIDTKCAWPDHSCFVPSAMGAAMEGWRADGNKVETGAYMIRAESDPKKRWYSWSKQRYVAEVVLGRPWRDRKIAQAFFMERRTLRETWEALRGPADWVGWGPFMAGQVVADLRHTRYLEDAPDVGRWAPVGPGSARGLNRLAGRPLKAAVSQEQGLHEMLQLQALLNERSAPHVPEMELHDVQNCLCETDKYLRVASGEGRPRAQYVAGRGW